MSQCLVIQWISTFYSLQIGNIIDQTQGSADGLQLATRNTIEK